MANYDIPLYPSKRLRYFNNQFLVEQDFIDDQAFHIADQQAQRRALCAAGVCEGLTVKLAGGKLTVDPGTAIGTDGKLLALVVATPGPDPTLLANATYRLHIQAVPDVATDDATTGLGTKDKTRWTQAPKLGATAQGTPLPAGAIGLATFEVTNGAVTTVSDAGRQNSGVRLPSVSGQATTLTMLADGMAGLSSGLTVQDQSGQVRPALRVLDQGGNEAFVVDTSGGTRTGRITVGGLGDIGQLHVSGLANLDSNTFIKGELQVTNAATFKGQVTADNAASPAIFAQSSTNIGLYAHGAKTGIQCGGKDAALVATHDTSSYSATLGTQTAAGSFTGPVTMSNNLNVQGQVRFANVLGDKAVVWDNYGVGLNNSNISLFYPIGAHFSLRTNDYNGAELFSVDSSGNVRIRGPINMDSNLLGVNGSLNVTNATTLKGTLQVSGLTQLLTTQIAGPLTVNGDASANNLSASSVTAGTHAGDIVKINAVRNNSHDGHFVKLAYEAYTNNIGNDTFVIFFDDNGAQGVRLNRAGQWGAISDASVKKDVVTIEPVLDKVMELRPVRFRWKATDTASIGVVAQETEQVFPELVIEGGPPDNRLKSVSYTELGVLAVAALQEMKKQYDARLAELETKLAQAPTPTTRKKP